MVLAPNFRLNSFIWVSWQAGVGVGLGVGWVGGGM